MKSRIKNRLGLIVLLIIFIICVQFSAIAGRTKSYFISDLHMGDARSTNTALSKESHNYGWFNENSEALKNFLIAVYNDPSTKNLVIIGDLFDEWICPYSLDPINGYTTQSYFNAIANAPLNKPVVDVLKTIAADDSGINLIYVPGNHDMLMKENTLQNIIPGIQIYTNSKQQGMGLYLDNENNVVAEHGHRYDMWNAPNPIPRQGSILPIGFYMARACATKSSGSGEGEFYMDYIKTKIESYLPSGCGVSPTYGVCDISPFNGAPPFIYKAYFEYCGIPDIVLSSEESIQIFKMDGINYYYGNWSFDKVNSLYQNIYDNWDSQQAHFVNPQTGEKLEAHDALAYGASTLEDAADDIYVNVDNIVANIIIFGHTHKDMITGWHYDSLGGTTVSNDSTVCSYVYANTGTWIDSKYVASGYNTRTYVVVETGDVVNYVTLLQYNTDGTSTTLGQREVQTQLPEEHLL